MMTSIACQASSQKGVISSPHPQRVNGDVTLAADPVYDGLKVEPANASNARR